MAETLHAGSDVASGTYICTACAFKMHVASSKRLPRCLACGGSEYHTVFGGETADDRFPRSGAATEIDAPTH
jgi:Zinc-ribbon containing domain